MDSMSPNTNLSNIDNSTHTPDLADNNPPTLITRSFRVIHPLAYLHDYICNNIHDSTHFCCHTIKKIVYHLLFIHQEDRNLSYYYSCLCG